MTQVINILGLTDTSLDQLVGELALENGSTPEEATVQILREIQSGLIDVGLGAGFSSDGPVETYVTLSLSTRGRRAYNRRQRQAQVSVTKFEVLEALEAKRPQRIGDLVKATEKDRAVVQEALRDLREEGKVFSFKQTNSNFQVAWSTDPTNAEFDIELLVQEKIAAAVTEIIDAA